MLMLGRRDSGFNRGGVSLALTHRGGTPIIWGTQVHVPLNNGTVYKEEGGGLGEG